MINLYCGYDDREAVGFHVFVASVLRHASQPVKFCAIASCALPEGSNAFTFSRFLVPYLMGFEGVAIFADGSDMLMRDDIAKLAALYDPTKAVQVVKHSYKTRHKFKYVGTDMYCHNRDYPRKNWASLMIMNCAHAAWAEMTPDRVAAMSEAPSILLGLKFVDDADIGELPAQWNCLVDEGQPIEGSALLHWTAGIPAFTHYHDAPGAAVWRVYRDVMSGA